MSSASIQPSPMSRLSNDSLGTVFSYLEPREMANAYQTCRLWKTVLQGNGPYTSRGLEDFRFALRHIAPLPFHRLFTTNLKERMETAYKKAVNSSDFEAKTLVPIILANPHVHYLFAAAELKMFYFLASQIYPDKIQLTDTDPLIEFDSSEVELDSTGATNCSLSLRVIQDWSPSVSLLLLGNLFNRLNFERDSLIANLAVLVGTAYVYERGEYRDCLEDARQVNHTSYLGLWILAYGMIGHENSLLPKVYRVTKGAAAASVPLVKSAYNRAKSFWRQYLEVFEG